MYQNAHNNGSFKCYLLSNLSPSSKSRTYAGINYVNHSSVKPSFKTLLTINSQKIHHRTIGVLVDKWLRNTNQRTKLWVLRVLLQKQLHSAWYLGRGLIRVSVSDSCSVMPKSLQPHRLVVFQAPLWTGLPFSSPGKSSF